MNQEGSQGGVENEGEKGLLGINISISQRGKHHWQGGKDTTS
jgi:hypothetical protein